MLDPEIRVVVESEEIVSGSPAQVFVYKGRRLITKVVAKIESRKGADGRFYPSVTLRIAP